MNLYRFVRGLGLRPVLCGNIKGLHDPYRNPETQAAFAVRWGQGPGMVTSFADGTKIAFEQAVVANATGMGLLRPGMLGPTVPAGTSLRDAVGRFPSEELLHGPGVVDYLVGAEPAPGVFILAECTHPRQRHYLDLYKLGPGPLYCFHTPYHLCHFEVPNSVARAALFADAALTVSEPPTVEVVTVAKVPLPPGALLDGPGGFAAYGICVPAVQARQERHLPMGLSEGCRLLRPLERDQLITESDVERPPARLCDRLRIEQEAFVSRRYRAPGQVVAPGPVCQPSCNQC
jgi:predicted homoserine dehydrogenase-like protein